MGIESMDLESVKKYEEKWKKEHEEKIAEKRINELMEEIERKLHHYGYWLKPYEDFTIEQIGKNKFMVNIKQEDNKKKRDDSMSSTAYAMEYFNTINKPQHYADKEIEVIDYIRDTLTEDQYEGYCIGNVIKYVSRYRLKGGVEDLKKAQYYLEEAIQEVD